jgi:hypothetical protein
MRVRARDRLKNGREINEAGPITTPIHGHVKPGLRNQIQEAIRSERLADELKNSGLETFEESQDFDVGDPDDLTSEWEEHYDPPDPEAPISEQVEQGMFSALKRFFPEQQEETPSEPPQETPESIPLEEEQPAQE